MAILKSHIATPPSSLQAIFARTASRCAGILGNAWAFILAVAVVILWSVTGPIFDFSDTWQLVINTGTTIVTFLMVFLIQNTQNRDAKALHLKLDELIRAFSRASNSMLNIEDLGPEELAKLEQQYRTLREKALLNNVPEPADAARGS